MSGEQRFDAIVIGAGQAGPFLGATLVARGMKVALIEERDLGGTCVNRGCTPTKTLRKSARVAHMARRASEFGVQTGSVQVNFRAAMERMQRRVEEARCRPGWASWKDSPSSRRAVAWRAVKANSSWCWPASISWWRPRWC